MEIEIRNYNTGKEGKQVYPDSNWIKNISWYNLENTILGIIYAHLIFMFIWDLKNYKIVMNIKKTKFWLPPMYSENYYEGKIIDI